MVQKLCVACNRRVSLKCKSCDCGHVFSGKDMVIVESRKKVENETIHWDTWRLRRLKDARVRVTRKPLQERKRKKVSQSSQHQATVQHTRHKLYDGNNNSNGHGQRTSSLYTNRETSKAVPDFYPEDLGYTDDRIWKEKTHEMEAALAEINRRLLSQQSIWTQLNIPNT